MANRGSPGVVMSNASATSSAFEINPGGRFGVSVIATGYVAATNFLTLQKLGPDGATWLNITQAVVDDDDVGVADAVIRDLNVAQWDANGYKALDLDAGSYRFTETGALTAIYASVGRIL